MVQLMPNPFYFEDARFKLGGGADTLEGQCSKIEATPGSATVWKGLTPSARFARAGDWALGIDFAQDWETATSLSNYLFDHEGEVVPVEFAPVAGGQTFYGTVVCSPGSIGGSQGSVATSSVSLEMGGKPSKIAPGV